MMTFFFIALAIYLLINVYIFVRGWKAVPPHTWLRLAYVFVFLILAFAYLGGRILEHYHPGVIADLLRWIGSIWFAAMLYFFLAVILIDLARLANLVFHWYPSSITANYARARSMTALITVGVVTLILIVARANAMFPAVRTLNLSIPKTVSGPRTLRIALASDLHLGTMIGKSRLDRIVNTINGLSPDVILLAGDIVDEDIGPVIRENQGDAIRSLKAPLGIFAVTGNHEYISGVEAACAYLTAHGVTMLRDSIARLNGSVYVVGREDRSSRGHLGRPRKLLPELMTQVDRQLPVILLDHQPFDLEQASENGIDLQLSGHTHHGQLWPLSYITDLVYQVSHGYRRIGNTQVYVSVGVGTWGPPMRLGDRPEIVCINLAFQ